ncbi:MurR/RpiR family transcriptional regulator [Thalassospira sp.]|uniref:MurR/RpiR family transcriptional regulator n=1 Tax=Thalassospira sp. TaxID=1912094 RepID=UPI000C3F8D98|nr:MurR/RpiR family transcriptional regulator [Thalassospira sp.]MBC07439.1 RpiR family transcriptional regulator [Thalassospira sp.]|tara:strand:+ start:1938 stop:2786 length:849 start_codon:yes stop_codon:yes gene_type:complete
MASRLILRIHEKQARLTSGEKKIAQTILENQDIIETHTATEIANLSGVSKATAARFFRSLGYADFEEVRLQAREERNQKQPYRQTVVSDSAVSLGRSIGDHLELELQNLTRSFEELSSYKLMETIDIIASAPSVWFLGFGAEDGVARTGRAMFSRLRHGVHYISGIGQDWSSDLAMVGPRDALILLTIDTRPKVMRPIINYARTSRMRVITLTDHSYEKQAARFSDVVLPCHVTSYGLLPTHATLLSTLRLMGIAYAGKNPESVKQRADTLDAIVEELDIME